MAGARISFTDKLLLQDATCIFLLQGPDAEGREIFVYLAVSGENLEHFKRSLDRPLFDVQSLGEVLVSGPGAPTEQDKRYMEATYGFNHDAMQPIG